MSCSTKKPGSGSELQPNENISADPFIPRNVYSEENYSGMDIELTFWKEDSEEPCGIWGPLIDFFDDSPEVEIVPDTSDFPVGKDIEGSYETRTWDGFIICSFVPNEETAKKGHDRTIYSITSTRGDIFTYRGIHVGSSLEEVFSAYPDLDGLGYDLNTWRDDPNTEKEIRYTPEEYRGSLAPWITFHFKGETVVKIEMEYLQKGKAHEVVSTENSKNDAYFDDVLFIGDSIMEGIRQYVAKERKNEVTLGNAEFLTSTIGITLADLVGDNQPCLYYYYGGKEDSIENIIRDINKNRIFLLLGLNDLAAADPNIEIIIDRYSRLINSLRTVNPNSEIVVITPTPKTASSWLPEYTKNRNFGNVLIGNLVDAIIKMCNEEDVEYINMFEILKDENGALSDDYCRDGYIHLNDMGSKLVVEALYEFAIGKK